MTRALALVTVLLLLAACATGARAPQCRGPLERINTDDAERHHG